MKNHAVHLFPLVCLLSSGILFSGELSAAEVRTHNVILITTDGLRWQEVFTGVDPGLLNRGQGASETRTR
ncbi:MAG TPA: hypothetical protein GYA07_03605 [Verrucomicrobia bacterium]|nr:hypothetical protein [Verrucomicrobiota bacterium]HOP96631.1 hypothetical protein [Verrucomicrobiota bacterium]HPU55528.1 hypothetical protein [Verrucomicrobiota bacterium]